MGTLDAFFYFCRYKCASPVMLMLVRFLNLLDFRECNWWRFRCFELLVSSLPFPFPVVFMLLQIAMHLFTYWFSNLKRIVKAPQLSSDLCKQAVYRKSCCRVCMRLQMISKINKSQIRLPLLKEINKYPKFEVLSNKIWNLISLSFNPLKTCL
jgi:hypothetical protein